MVCGFCVTVFVVCVVCASYWTLDALFCTVWRGYLTESRWRTNVRLVAWKVDLKRPALRLQTLSV